MSEYTTKNGKRVPDRLSCTYSVIRNGMGQECGYVFEGELSIVNGKMCYLVGEEVTLEYARMVCPECGAIKVHKSDDYRLANLVGVSVGELSK